ncbi:sulfotransferase 1C2-like [Ostrea edulis]|uniref:sulfotransferase 1C2-like n=1 Tax=Ostrea edulis TaxID=37623 RepID=UPI0024AED8EC|nr:sulfotransferase 1C2-like [Ostrea edulis]XP_048730429.2 sulfotransferase 1C2-like [Ostrea edulis]XP_048730430.2 sulfotransferase 1C2-like [Ostrea edulis]
MPFEDLVHIDDCCFSPFPPLQKDARKHLEAVRDMKTNEDDVLLITYPKCGTHWVWEIIAMLLKEEAEYHPLVREHVFLDAVDPSSLDSLPSPRVFNTHIPFRWLPQEHFRKGRKAVNVIRNPKDAAVSLYCHWHSSNELGVGSLSWSEFFEEVVVGQYKNLFGGYFDFQKELYRAAQSDPEFSLHTMYYETLKKDPVSEILSLAGYLGVTCSRELAADIADKCSFHKLKHASDNLKDHGEIAKLMKNMDRKLPNFYRKGKVGDWKNWYTVSQNERHDARIKEEMKDIDFDLQLIYENL